VLGLAALAVAAFAGGAYAATQSSGPNTRQAFLNDVAKRLNVTPQQLTAALNGAAIDQLQAGVKSGNLTQAQANAIEQRLKQSAANPAVPFGLFGPGGPGGAGGAGGPGYPGAPGGPGGFGPPGLGKGGQAPQLRHFAVPFAVAGGIAPAASYLGLTEAQLMQQLSSGKSLAQIATAKGKSVTGLKQAISAAMKARFDKLVANKMLTAAQEKQILSNLSARIASGVNQKGLPFPRFRPGLRFQGVPSPPKNGGPATPLGPASQRFVPQGPSA
jgi:hypothetical protein